MGWFENYRDIFARSFDSMGKFQPEIFLEATKNILKVVNGEAPHTHQINGNTGFCLCGVKAQHLLINERGDL